MCVTWLIHTCDMTHSYVCETLICMTWLIHVCDLTHSYVTWFIDQAPWKSSMLQCVAVCCSVLQCVAVCCSVLQQVAVCCSVLQCVAVCCSKLQCVAVCCSELQWVAVCCSVLQCVAVYKAPWKTLSRPSTWLLEYSEYVTSASITPCACSSTFPANFDDTAESASSSLTLFVKSLNRSKFRSGPVIKSISYSPCICTYIMYFVCVWVCIDRCKIIKLHQIENRTQNQI